MIQPGEIVVAAGDVGNPVRVNITEFRYFRITSIPTNATFQLETIQGGGKSGLIDWRINDAMLLDQPAQEMFFVADTAGTYVFQWSLLDRVQTVTTQGAGGGLFNGEVEFKDARNAVLTNNPLAIAGISSGDFIRAFRVAPNGYLGSSPVANSDALADGNLGSQFPDDTGARRYNNFLSNVYEGTQRNRWNRHRQNNSTQLLALATYTSLPGNVLFTHFTGDALIILIDVTAIAAAPSLTLTVYPRDPITGTIAATPLIASPAIVATGLYPLVVDPSSAAFPGAATFVQSAVPFDLVLVASGTVDGTNTITFRAYAADVGH